MGGRGKIKPSSGSKAGGIKDPASPPQISAATGKPTFCLAHLQSGYHIEDCEKGERAVILAKLGRLAQLTWLAWESEPKQSGFEKLPSSQLMVKPPAIFAENNKCYASRFSDVGRLVGFREGVIFHIVWIARSKIY